jgi:VIT1/CCC1 family predicted Fe2+/Mn2+ transporter
MLVGTAAPFFVLLTLFIFAIAVVFLRLFRHKPIKGLLQDERLLNYSGWAVILLVAAAFAVFIVVNNK